MEKIEREDDFIIRHMPLDAHLTSMLNIDKVKYRFYYNGFLNLEYTPNIVRFNYNLTWIDFKCFEFERIARERVLGSDEENQKWISGALNRGYSIITDVNKKLIFNYNTSDDIPHEIMIKEETSKGFLCADFFQGK